tara:strand:+ start:353 stop:1207 length:855 start_codon:yes stop_codon:yes gene_type:complete
LSRNKSRLGNSRADTSESIVNDLLDFVTPTEFVDLPSKGQLYPKGHPLRGKDSIEIRFMTAKDEDILTNQSLIKKGVAIDRFVQSIILDEHINVDDLVIGDKNAIIIAARASAYGVAYEAVVGCSKCGTENEMVFDLNKTSFSGLDIPEGLEIQKLDNGYFTTIMPKSQLEVTFRVFTSVDEKYLTTYLVDNFESEDRSITTEQLKRMIVMIRDVKEPEVIEMVIDRLTSIDVRHLKICLRAMTPNVEIKETLVCKECGNEQEVQIPFGIDFFWPDREIFGSNV